MWPRCHGQAQDGFKSIGRDAPRIGQVDFVVPAVKRQCMTGGMRLHKGHGFLFPFVGTAVQHLDATAFRQQFEPDFLNTRTFALFQQGRFCILDFARLDKLRGADQQFPAPLLARCLGEVCRTGFSPPLGFEFADNLVLLPGEFPRHFQGKGHRIERADFILEDLAAGRTASADGQVGGFFDIHQHRLGRRGIIRFVQLKQVNFFQCFHK
jgi:hypothetical protein